MASAAAVRYGFPVKLPQHRVLENFRLQENNQSTFSRTEEYKLLR
jgi:hypothetical protein